MPKNLSLNVDATGLEFKSDYDPIITYWTLSDTGKARAAIGIFPGISQPGQTLLHRLKELGVMEEDELGSLVSLTPGGIKQEMKRLMGFGLVKQVS